MNLDQLNPYEMIYNSDKFGFNQKRRFWASDINNAIEQSVSWLDEKSTGDTYNELVSVKPVNSLLALERIQEKHYSVVGNPETPIKDWRRKEVSKNEWKELQSENESRLSNTRYGDGGLLLWYGG